MFHQIFKRSHTIQKHTDSPLLKERLMYLNYCNERGISQHTLRSIAQYLLRIADFLPLHDADKISIEEIEEAAETWARYQSNHPQKRIKFSKTGKIRFIWYATDWLSMIDKLKPTNVIIIPLFHEIFERPKTIKRHSVAPLLEERLAYLQYWADNGAVENSLKRIAQYLLIIMEYLDFYKLRIITTEEIEKAAECWANSETNSDRKNKYSKFAKSRFIRDASAWLTMLNCLNKESNEPLPFDNYLNQYIRYLRLEQGLSQNTIKSRNYIIQDFLININNINREFSELTPLIVDEILIKKHNEHGYSRNTVQNHASVIRSFLNYAESQNWCQTNLANSIKSPRVYSQESLPYSPNWDDVKQVLEISNEHPTEVRNRAIVMLLAIYGLRCSEVIRLCLEDLDWKNELLHIRRSKDSKNQVFPLSKSVGEAILCYLKTVRQNNCSLREVFLCMRSPYRPLTTSAIYQIVSRKLKPLNLNIKHHGPHALRHACATRLINEGVRLEEIRDYLGHKGIETTRIYTKVDLANLRKVSEFEIGDLL